jgi:hypothetical protein
MIICTAQTNFRLLLFAYNDKRCKRIIIRGGRRNGKPIFYPRNIARVRSGRVGKTADIKAEISNVLYSYGATGLRGSDRLKTNNMDFGRTVRLLAEFILFC